MDHIVVEIGARNVAQAVYKGYRIQVVTGYSAVSDNFPIHVYVEKAEPYGRYGRREKLPLSGFGSSVTESFEHGFDAAAQEIDRL